MNIAEHIRSLTGKIPNNHLGLPEGIYAPDLLPAPLVLNNATNTVNTTEHPEGVLPAAAPSDVPQAQEESTTDSNNPDILSSPQSLTLTPSTNPQLVEQYESDIKAAFMRLDYCEGYPTLKNIPFWSQLPFEPADAFLCFEAYRDQGKTGARQTYIVPEDSRFRNMPEPSQAFLEECYHTYYWAARTKAYDMFSAAHRRKERERRAIETEDIHYLQASKLMGICNAYLDANGEELIETMTPKAFLEMFKTAVQVQRISTGLSANGNNNADNPPPGASLELIMRSISQQTREAIPHDNSGEIIENGINPSNSAQKLSKIMQDPETIKIAQELIIKMHQPAQQGAF